MRPRNNRRPRFEAGLAAAKMCSIGLIVLCATASRAEVRTWDGSTGSWSDGARWGGTVPQDGDEAVVNGGSVLLGADTADLAAFTITGGTLTFTNWATALRATNVFLNGGLVSLPLPFTTAEMSNRVNVVCSNFMLAGSATINADSKGFKASQATLGTAYGPGAPPVTAHYGGGAGHGGAGGPGDSSGATGGGVYGNANAPVAPGSGGGGNSVTGHGGGTVRIRASGAVTVNGTIRAGGGSGTTHGGAGSGGGIFISCARFSGAGGGRLQADGGNIAIVNNVHGGAGGGGRIAVAIGVSDSDVQKLTDGDPVDALVAHASYGSYTGTVSVTNGTTPVAGYAENHAGFPGTWRFLTTSSAGAFWLLVQGTPAPYDAPAPYGNGLNASIPAGTWVTNTATSPYDEAGGLRRLALSWSVTNQLGAVVAGGTGNQAVFQMQTNLVLTYAWTNACLLSVLTASAAEGTVNAEAVGGYYTQGVSVAGIEATPQAGYSFNRWFGDGVPAGEELSNPLTVVMTQPRTLIASFQKDGGEARTWKGTGNWADTNRWTPAGIPGRLDDAYLASGTVTVSAAHSAGTLTVSNGTAVLFTNWTASLTVSNMAVRGRLLLPAAFAESAMSNRIHVICTNFHLEAGGVIDGKGRGFLGSASAWLPGQGPGKGQVTTTGYYGGGGGYGGVGGDGERGAGGAVYGCTNAPLDPGSGGGGTAAGAGGGVVRIAALGAVTLDGTIDVDGSKSANHGGSGSGGGIFISCRTFSGAASGTLLARGADGIRVSTSHGGAGGGGRVAVAIGMTADDLQDLIEGTEPENLIITATQPGYDGSVSVTNGISQFDGHNHDGAPGTHRFLQVASGAAYSVLVRGEPADRAIPRPLGYGLHVNIPDGTWLTNSVESPFDAGAGIGWGCLGWTVTNAPGATVAEGSDTQAVFEVLADLTVTYRWTNLYWLGVTSPVPEHGSVNAGAVEGWYTNGASVAAIAASASNGYTFHRWTGIGVPAGHEYDNPLAVGMTEPRFLIANFASDVPVTRTWNGTGNWINTGLWSPPGLPGPQDAAHIASGTVTVSEAMSAGSLAVSNGATVLFTNWSARLTVEGPAEVAGRLTLPAAYPDGAMSNRVHIACDAFTLTTGGVIAADGRGYMGGRDTTITSQGHGPGKGLLQPGQAYYGGGGGHGGTGHPGRLGIGGAIYDLTNAPSQPGSGGAGNCVAGNGGGAVRIAADGKVRIDGTIDADGSASLAHGGGGSGGAIFISCSDFEGAAVGRLSARGGNVVYYSASQYGGPGGGGRISVVIGASAEDLQQMIAGQATRFPALPYHPSYLGTAAVEGGTTGFGHDGETGTLQFIAVLRRGSVFTVR